MAAPKSEHVLKKPPPSIIDGYKDASAGIDNIGHTSKNPRFKDRRYYALLEANAKKGLGEQDCFKEQRLIHNRQSVFCQCRIVARCD